MIGAAPVAGRRAQLGLGVHAVQRQREAAALQLDAQELGLGGVVFDQQDANRLTSKLERHDVPLSDEERALRRLRPRSNPMLHVESSAAFLRRKRTILKRQRTAAASRKARTSASRGASGGASD